MLVLALASRSGVAGEIAIDVVALVAALFDGGDDEAGFTGGDDMSASRRT
jgi:hypothetical protein